MMIMHGVLNGLFTRSFIPRVDVILMVSMIAIFYYCNEPFQTIHIIVFLYLLPFTPYALYSNIPLLPPPPFIPTPIPILSRLSLFDPLTPLFPRFPVLETSFRVVFIYSYSLTTLFVSSDTVMRFSVDLNRRMLGFAKNASILRRFIGSGKELMFGVEVGAVCDI